MNYKDRILDNTVRLIATYAEEVNGTPCTDKNIAYWYSLDIRQRKRVLAKWRDLAKEQRQRLT